MLAFFLPQPKACIVPAFGRASFFATGAPVNSLFASSSGKTFCLCLGDILCLLAALWPSMAVLSQADFHVIGLYALVLAVLLPLLSFALGRYHRLASPFSEFRGQCGLLALTMLLLLSLMLILQALTLKVLLAFGASFLLALFLLPLGRSLLRMALAHCPWWMRNVLVFDQCAHGQEFVAYLSRHPEYGLKPLGLWELGQEAQANVFSEQKARFGEVLCIVLTDHLRKQSLLKAAQAHFSNVLLIPVDEDFAPSLFAVVDLGLVQGFVPRKSQKGPVVMFGKRLMDLLLGSLLCVLFLPFFILIALAIRLESPGPVFYRQERIGRYGRPISIVKFRTMVCNADAVLSEVLASDPQKMKAWEEDHKLQRDPRITRVGLFLRKLSLDELPQLVNIVLGEMSLVGPRPIVQEEIVKYGEVYASYCQVRPGLTGLWQVSGRNNTSYEERVAYDYVYITNWSLGMDVWILARTLPVVLAGQGAY